MKIFDLAGTAHGHWNNVVELQFRSSATHSATTLIAYPHELFYVVRYVPALADARLFTHGNHGSCPLNALTFPLVPSEQQGMDIVAVHVVIRPIEPVLEPPVPTVACEDHEDRFMSLQLLFFEKHLFTDDGARVFVAPDSEPCPAHDGWYFGWGFLPSKSSRTQLPQLDRLAGISGTKISSNLMDTLLARLSMMTPTPGATRERLAFQA
ncbi:hypothetical protein [Streptomyces sp. UG1]|uniref:hypothetical protein n=1 Tax=Streptomyces sp. UG1 TaxID=3417652 RepID=UPI003CE6906C